MVFPAGESRYCVPRSFPWRSPWVGSCDSQNQRSRSTILIFSGS
jgi:hypothetical protein